MKKEYKKPIVLFESFVLSTNIAAGCAIKPDDEDLWVPGIDQYAFTTSCGFDVTDGAGGDGQYENLCYQTMTGDSIGGVHTS